MQHMSNVPPVRNEPALTYAPGSPERAEIKRELERLRGEQPEVPLVIGGRERTTNEVREQREPHLRERVCATLERGGAGRGGAGHRRRARGAPRLELLVAGRPLRRAAARRRPAGGPMAAARQRRDDARAGQDGARGRDRRGRRAGRLLALQRLLRRADRASSSRSRRPASTTAWSSAASRASSTPSRRSTSRPSAATCRPRRR